MRTRMQRVLNPEVGDVWFYSNQTRVWGGVTVAGSRRTITRIKEVESDGDGGHIRYELTSPSRSTIDMTRRVCLEKYSPLLSRAENKLNRAEKYLSLLIYHEEVIDMCNVLLEVDL